MCNYYCVYVYDDRFKQESVRYLTANADKVRGFYYKLFPKLSSLPDLMKHESFGLKRGFFAVCMYDGDGACFPSEKVFKPHDTFFQYLYTQDDECSRFFARFKGVKRPPPVYRDGEYDEVTARFNKVRDEEKALEEMMQEDWKKESEYKKSHAKELSIAKETWKRCDRQCRLIASEKAIPRFEALKAHNPPNVWKDMYEAFFLEEYRKVRNSYPYKYPMDKAMEMLQSVPGPSLEYIRRRSDLDKFKKQHKIMQ